MSDISSCRNARHQHQRRYIYQILLFVLISSSIICTVISFNTCCNNNNWGMRKTHYKKSIPQKYNINNNNRNEGKYDFPNSRHGLLLSKVSAENVDVDVDNNPTNIDTDTASTTNIVFPGGGIFFYHQAGVVNFLREEGYDLSTCTFSGASAGALTATLTATDVDFYDATDLALKMADEAGVWDRSNGLQGIWGPLIEDWLNALLPDSCIESVQDRITLLVTPVPSFGKSKISNFEDRNDLIKCNMASVHLPWFLDGKLTSNFRSRPHIDGSFLSKDEDYIPDNVNNNNNNNNNNFVNSSNNNNIILDWTKDPYMSSKKNGMDFVEALSPDGIRGLMNQGKIYGKIMEDQGIFDSLLKK